MERTFFTSLTSGLNLKKLAFSALFVASTFAGFSAPQPPTEGLTKVTPLGIQDGDMVFKIKTANANADKLYITLSDKDGLTLYKGIFSDKNLTKTFKVPAEVGSLNLVVTNLTDKSVERYEIANEKKFVEELVITTVR